jgi:hypothetical protein
VVVQHLDLNAAPEPRPEVNSPRRFALHVAVVCLALFAVRLWTLPPFVESVDGWCFVRGVVRYSALEARPHWPGYPVYIALGKLLARATGDAAFALHLLSVAASSLAAAPLMVLARAWRAAGGADAAAADRAGLVAGVLWGVAPGSWLTGSEILSDPLALLLSLLLLLCCWCAGADADRTGSWPLAVAAVAGLLLGVRLAALPLLFPAAYVVFRRQRAAAVVLFLAIVAAWGLGQVWQDGAGFFDVAASRLHQHFGAWTRRALEGGRVWQRPLGLVQTLAVHGLGLYAPGAPALRLPATLLLLVLGGLGLRRVLGHAVRAVPRLYVLFVVPYALFVSYGQDAALTRYALPLVAAASLAAALGLPERGGLPIGLGAALAVAVVSGPLAVERQATPPLGHQLAAYAAQHVAPQESVFVVTGDAPYARVFLEELDPGLPLAEAGLDELGPLAERLVTKRVYATAPPAEKPEQWVPEVRFVRGPFVESRGPLVLTLYRRDPLSLPH